MIIAEFVHRLRGRIEAAKVHEAVAQGTPHQECTGQVVDALGIVRVRGILGADPALDEAVVHGEREAEVGLPCDVNMLWQLCQCAREVGQAFPPDGPGVKSKELLLLQLLGPEAWGHPGGYCRYATSS